MKARGGSRPNAGRKRGLASITAEQARNYAIQRITAELEPILTGQIEAAKGMYYEVIDDQGEKVVYQQKPNARVAEYLISQVIGKAKETTDLNIKVPFSLYELAKMRDAERLKMTDGQHYRVVNNK
ncbi:MAG: hypothetical protein JWO50_579 [Candidatus Kaiserbacteria bacterium]|nr:hypothetical protein [Candidatus Kaiserbacteria bacterium]